MRFTKRVFLAVFTSIFLGAAPGSAALFSQKPEGRPAFGQIGDVFSEMASKYISTDLTEEYKALAFAGDIGVTMLYSPKVRFGAAVQNLSHGRQPVDMEDYLPRMARVGMAYSLSGRGTQPTLVVDAPYYFQDDSLKPSVGLAMTMGSLAVRTGYRAGRASEKISFGAAWSLGRTTLEYVYGMAEQLDALHKTRLSLKF